MRVLDRKVLRELFASKGLLIAITSLIAVGVMCFIYMRSAYNNLKIAPKIAITANAGWPISGSSLRKCLWPNSI